MCDNCPPRKHYHHECTEAPTIVLWPIILELLNGDSSDEEDIVENDGDNNEEVQNDVGYRTQKMQICQYQQQSQPNVENELEEFSRDDSDGVPLTDLFMVRANDKKIIKLKKCLHYLGMWEQEYCFKASKTSVRQAKNAQAEFYCFSFFFNNAMIGSIVAGQQTYT